MTIIIHNGKFYRPAGFHTPKLGERYVAKDGKIKLYQLVTPFRGERLIVREIIFADESAFTV